MHTVLGMNKIVLCIRFRPYGYRVLKPNLVLPHQSDMPFIHVIVFDPVINTLALLYRL